MHGLRKGWFGVKYASRPAVKVASRLCSRAKRRRGGCSAPATHSGQVHTTIRYRQSPQTSVGCSPPPIQAGGTMHARLTPARIGSSGRATVHCANRARRP
eukprot:scaffold3236_cov138-Isochrysis_galbana.AAC.2